MGAISLRISQIRRLISRDPRDILKFSFFMLRRIPQSIIDRYVIRFGHSNISISGHPKKVTNAKSPMIDSEELIEFGRRAMSEKKLDLLGKEIGFTWPPNWEGGELGEWPKGHSQAIQYYGIDTKKDIKIIWEFHRLQWLPSIAALSKINEDKVLASEILDLIIDYEDKHIVNKTVAWMEGIEVSMRAISILEAMSWLDEIIEEDERFSRIYQFLSKHAEWISSHLSLKWRLNNNHLLVELIGLLVLSERISWDARARKWKERSLRILENELNDQITNGRNWEPTTSYHKLITEGLLIVNHHCFDGEIAENSIGDITNKMVRTLSLLSDSEGNMPLVGDDDGGSMLPIYVGKDIRKNSEIFEIAARMGFDLETPESVCHYWEGQGMGVIRSEDKHVHFVSGAPLGKARQGSHRHLDMLSFTLSMDGKPIIFDGGTGQYFGDEEIRNQYRLEAFHSGIYSRTSHWAVIKGLFEIPRPPVGKFELYGEDVKISCEHPSGGWAERIISLEKSEVRILDSLELQDPSVVFIVSEAGHVEVSNGTWSMKWDDWEIVHDPIPAKFIGTEDMKSIGYGTYDGCYRIEFYHNQGVKCTTRIINLNDEKS